MRALILLLLPTLSWGHAMLDDARNDFTARTQSNASLKGFPCANQPPSNVPKYVQPGDTITVYWKETVQHPGSYEFFWSNSGDTNWVEIAPSVTDEMNEQDDLPHLYTPITFTVPADADCSNCTLQFRQTMTENPANPTYYYNCADFRTTATLPNPSPSPAPSPGNTGSSGNCHIAN